MVKDKVFKIKRILLKSTAGYLKSWLQLTTKIQIGMFTRRIERERDRKKREREKVRLREREKERERERECVCVSVCVCVCERRNVCCIP